MRKIIIKSVKTILIGFFLWVLSSSLVENVTVTAELEEFMNKGIYQEDISTSRIKYYKVPFAENQEEIPAFTFDGENSYPGSSGDIIVGLRSPFPDTAFIDPLITFFIGGHAAFCSYQFDDYKNTIETTDCFETAGISENKSVSEVSSRNYWEDENYRTTYIGLRVKTSDENKRIVNNELLKNLGAPYNYSFIFNQEDSYYCSDYISRAYSKVGVNLNKDMLGVTIYDLIVSKDTYIFLYKTIDSKGVRSYYYLG